MEALVSYLTDTAVAVKLTGAAFLIYGLVSIPLARRARSEDGVMSHVLAGGASLAMGTLAFSLGLAGFLVGGIV